MTSGKLVRDRIPEIVRSEGSNPRIPRLAGAELLSAL